MIDLLNASDADFQREWRSFTDADRGALPDDVRSACYARYNKITPWVKDSIERLRREQERPDATVHRISDAKSAADAVALPSAIPELTTTFQHHDAVETLWKLGLPPGEKTGWASVDRHYTVAPGQLTILTGWPGSGKSEWLDHLLINLGQRNWKFAVFSAENQPVQLHIAKLMEKWAKAPFSDGPNRRIPFDSLAEITDEMLPVFRFITPKETAVNVHKIVQAATPWLTEQDGRHPGLIIDPWNEVEHWRPRGMTETEYVSETLSYVRNWARANGVHVWIVAHPAKQPREDGRLPIPTPDMISGSQHWWNKADCALTVYRDLHDETDSRIVSVFVQKIRFKQVGKTGEIKLLYDKITGRYNEI